MTEIERCSTCRWFLPTGSGWLPEGHDGWCNWKPSPVITADAKRAAAVKKGDGCSSWASGTLMDHPIGDAIVRLTRFYYSPWGAAKGARWESIADLPFEDKSLDILINRLLIGKDERLRNRILAVLR